MVGDANRKKPNTKTARFEVMIQNGPLVFIGLLLTAGAWLLREG
ncbi:hypothetical protein CZ787_13185 [Halomonas citrativorans]|uniref:Uncharacterized protein n=1 Tax=Halomonas citrativorans TaxID=2742612 RepID=A0A1R4I2H0_9GAMM|nr:hypothetical protein CZ787_13185 [Halomonas citrativorans]